MNTDSASRHSTGEYSSGGEGVTDWSSSSPSLPPPTSFKFTFGREERTRDSSPELGYKVKQESEDEGYEGYEGYTYQEYGRISPDTTPPPANPRTPNRKRRRATPTAKSVSPGKRERKKPTPKITSKPSKIKNEPNEEDDWGEGDRQGERHVRYEPAGWTKEELDLVHELCKKNKTGREIWSELRNKLGCTKSWGSVSSCRRRVKISQVEWSSKDGSKVEHLLEAVKVFDKYKAIAYEFNKLSGRSAKSELFDKGTIESKLKSLEMEANKSPKK